MRRQHTREELDEFWGDCEKKYQDETLPKYNAPGDPRLANPILKAINYIFRGWSTN